MSSSLRATLPTLFALLLGYALMQIGNTLQGGTWNIPTTIYAPRYARLNLTFNF